MMMRYVIPILCAAVATGQVVSATYGVLTPWKGGGFGMFAVIDGPPARQIVLSATDDRQQSYRVVVPFGRFSAPAALSSRFAGELIAFPTTPRLRRLAGAVLNASVAPPRVPATLPNALLDTPYGPSLQKLVAARPTLEVIAARRAPGSGVDIREVTASVVRLQFDMASGLVRAETVATAGVAARAGGIGGAR